MVLLLLLGMNKSPNIIFHVTYNTKVCVVPYKASKKYSPSTYLGATSWYCVKYCVVKGHTSIIFRYTFHHKAVGSKSRSSALVPVSGKKNIWLSRNTSTTKFYLINILINYLGGIVWYLIDY